MSLKFSSVFLVFMVFMMWWSISESRLLVNITDRVFTWWRHQMETFPRYWPFVKGIHRSPVDSPHKNQWWRVLMFSLMCAWTSVWANNRDAGDLRRLSALCDVIVMRQTYIKFFSGYWISGHISIIQYNTYVFLILPISKLHCLFQYLELKIDF